MQFPFAGAVPASGPVSAMEPARPNGDAGSSGSLREIWAATYRSRFLVAGIFALCILMAVAIALLSTRLYQATASVEVRQEAEKVLGTEQDSETTASKADADRFLQTQLDIIDSRSMAQSVAESEGLYRGDAFLNAMDVEVDDTVERVGMSNRDIRRELVIGALQENLRVRYSGSTRIALISFTSPDARLSARIANGYAEAFIRNNLARKANSSVYALDFLRGQLAEAQERLAQSEQEVVDYARRTRIVDAGNAAGLGGGDGTRPQSLITAQLVQLNQAYTAALAERIQAQQRWSQVARVPLTSIPEVLGNNAVQALLGQRAQAQAAYEQQLATRREDYPSVNEAAAQVRELNRQIDTLGGNIRASIRNQYQLALARERQLAGEIDALKSGTLSEQNQGIELSILRREADTNRQQYEALLRRYNSVNAESGVQTNNLSIIDQAPVPSGPSWPKLPLNIALGIIAAMLLSALVVFLREQLFYRLRTPDELTNTLGLSILGVVPATADPTRELSDVKSVQSDAYNSIRTSLSLLSRSGAPRVMVVTSTQQGEGKSTASQALALSFARLGKRVLLIDVDLRRPNIHRLFGIPNTRGFSNILADQVDVSDAVRVSDQAGLEFIVAGDIPPNPSELINSPKLPALLRELGERYDVILLDSAPVLGLADAVILSSEADATVFVIESGRNSPRVVQTALARLRQGGGTVAGAVLVKFDPGRSGYGYGAEYGYSYDYSAKDG